MATRIEPMSMLLSGGRSWFLLVTGPISVPVVVVLDARDPAGDGVDLDVGRGSVAVQQRHVVTEAGRLVVLVPLDDATGRRSRLGGDRLRLLEGQGGGSGGGGPGGGRGRGGGGRRPPGRGGG